VHLFAQCAGTDPRVFGDGGFDIAAERKPHFGFGSGIHYCLGHAVARQDMSEALPLLARRMREPRLGGDATWLPDSGNTGPVRLPLVFTPG
jgi:cytochrome P450